MGILKSHFVYYLEALTVITGMSKDPIILIDDDIEDLELLKEMASKLGFNNQVFVFHDPITALQFLTNTVFTPFFIICDINMPKLNGFQFRKALLNNESIAKDSPFFFLSTSKTDNEIIAAEELKVTGYYQKSPTFSGMKAILKNIIDSLTE